ncbi:VOC family protein [Halobacillus locisalis]|uniref:Bleomycin resistance protein n=1 Tax=Halobacillus locisalis TaxID=220753 RepID=A0A838CP96_9BACI|nr:VOC family protein [Halobacillus locisalis]
MITPVFRIFDVNKAKDFYEEFLGFQKDWSHTFDENNPSYIQVSLHGIALHLSEHHGDASPGSSVRLKMDGIEAFHKELLEKDYPYMNPELEEAPWNTIECKVVDPSYNTFIFYEDITTK